jgi:outer membrane protein insertion porin family
MMHTLPLLLFLAGLAADGERVAAVRIENVSDQEEARLRRYVTVRAGEAFAAEEVRRSVRYLFATGEFADVIVERRRTATGIEVAFRLTPAPRLASIAVEGDLLRTPRQLHRATRLRDGETLWPRRLERAAQDAALELADMGYLEARVSASTSPATTGVRAVFRIQAGAMTLIEATRVTGLDELATQAAEQRLLSRPGHAFSRKRAQADGQKLRQQLRESGYWSASVDVRERYDPLQSRIALVFEVRPGPHTVLEIRGLTPSGRLKRQARRLLIDAGLRPDALEEVTELIEEDLRHRGFALANVTHAEEQGPDWRRVILVVEPGPLVRVASVRLEGAPEEDVARVVTTRAGQSFRAQQVERDAEALKRALEERGYAGTRADVDASGQGAARVVVFRMRPGVRTTLASIDVVTPVAVPGAATEDLGLRAGDPYRVGEVARARAALVAAYHDGGYPQVNVSIETRPIGDGGAVALVYRVDPAGRAQIERILVAGLQHTREEVVRRELLIREGDPLRWDRVLESHRRLSALGLFRGVSVYELDPDESERRSIVFAVEEGARTTFTGGVGAAGVSDRLRSSDVNPTLRASFEVTRRNLGGLDRDISLFARYSFRGSRLLATYREPFLLGHKTEMAISAFREEEERKTFNFDRVGVSVQGTRALAPRWNLILRYAFSNTRSSSINVDRQYQDERSSGPSFSLVHDTRDDPLDPHRGRFVTVDSQFSHAVLGGHSFSKSFVQTATFQRLRGPLLLAAGLRAGAAWTFRGQKLDAPDLFYAGGNYSMRGFETDAVAPTGGLALGVGSLELRCALGRGLSLAAFTDVGGVGTVYPTDADAHARRTLIPATRRGPDSHLPTCACLPASACAIAPRSARFALTGASSSTRGPANVAPFRTSRWAMLSSAIALLAAFLAQQPSQPPVEAVVVERVLAVVDRRPVLLSEVQLLERLRDLDQAAALDLLIDELLMYAEAGRFPQARPSATEEQAALASLGRVLSQGANADELRRVAHRQATILKYVGLRFLPLVRVSDEAALQGYEREYGGRADAPPFSKVEADIRQRLTKQELDTRIEEWTRRLRESAAVDYPAGRETRGP